MIMTDKLWEEFWAWLNEQAFGMYDEFSGELAVWLENSMETWKELKRCTQCGFRGITHELEHLHSYVISERDYCPNCNKYFDLEDLWGQAVADVKRDIRSGKLPPRQILGLVESFKLVAKEFDTAWIQELIIEKNAEKWNLLQRIGRKIKDDKSKEE